MNFNEEIKSVTKLLERFIIAVLIVILVLFIIAVRLIAN